MGFSEEVKKDILSRPYFKGEIKSGSMVPVIHIGDVVTVAVKERNLRRFDIVVFINGDKLICHYVWNFNRFIEPFVLQTRSMEGLKDFPISEEDYMGKVVSHQIPLWRKLMILLAK